MKASVHPHLVRSVSTDRNRLVSERAATAVIVRVHPEGQSTRAAARRSRPVSRQVDALAAVDAEHIGDGQGPGEGPLRPPVPLANRQQRPRIEAIDPLAQARDEANRLANPGFVRVAWIPQRARRAQAQGVRGLVGGARVNTLTLRIVMDVEHIQGSSPGLLVVLAYLLQPPGQERNVAVRATVGMSAEVVRPAVTGRVEVAGPPRERRA